MHGRRPRTLLMPPGLRRRVFCVCGTLGLAPFYPTHVPPWRNWPPPTWAAGRDKPRAPLGLLVHDGFQSLSQITSHPCSAPPLASPFTLDGISTTFPSTACKTLSAVCTPPFPACFLPQQSRPGGAGTLYQGLCTCWLALSASPSSCPLEFVHFALPSCAEHLPVPGVV